MPASSRVRPLYTERDSVHAQTRPAINPRTFRASSRVSSFLSERICSKVGLPAMFYRHNHGENKYTHIYISKNSTTPIRGVKFSVKPARHAVRVGEGYLTNLFLPCQTAPTNGSCLSNEIIIRPCRECVLCVNGYDHSNPAEREMRV